MNQQFSFCQPSQEFVVNQRYRFFQKSVWICRSFYLPKESVLGLYLHRAVMNRLEKRNPSKVHGQESTSNQRLSSVLMQRSSERKTYCIIVKNMNVSTNGVEKNVRLTQLLV